MQCSGYQPPEYIERGEVSEKFDIFSLGVVMIHLVSGRGGFERYACMHSEEFINQVRNDLSL
jgi:serine/threonine protein kinase